MARYEPINLLPTDTVETLRQGVQDNINRLIAQLNTSKVTEALDMRELRIKNLSWPTELHDAVNVEYLKDALEIATKDFTKKKAPIGVGLFYDKCTFGVAIDSFLYVANDVNPWYICAAQGLQLKWAAAVAKWPSTGADIKLRVNKNPADPDNPVLGESILQANFTIPATSNAVQTWTSFDITNFNLGDILTFDVVQAGSGSRGGDVVLVLKFKVTNPSP